MLTNMFYKTHIRNALCAFLAVLLVLLSGGALYAHADEVKTDLVVSIKDSGTVKVSIPRLEIKDLTDESVKLLMSIMEMTIKTDGKVLYTGKCDKLPTPVFQDLVLRTGEEIVLDVTLELPKYEADNSVQGVPFEMIWHFKASGENGSLISLNNQHFYSNNNINPGDILNYKIRIVNEGNRPNTPNPGPGNNGGGSTIKTGDDSVLNSPQISTFLIAASIFIVLCLATIIILPLVKRKKKKAPAADTSNSVSSYEFDDYEIYDDYQENYYDDYNNDNF